MNAVTGPVPLTPSTRAAATRQRGRLVVVLALTSGATDAIGFLALGSAFTSVMTGNMVLLGVGTADRDVNLVLSCSVAILSFMVGAAIGARVAGSPQRGDCLWPSSVTLALYIELSLLLLFAGAWWTLDSTPSERWLVPLLGLNAAAMGLQSSAIQRFGVSGLSTTYLTGTLTTVVIKLIGGHGLRKVGHSLTILLGLIVGAGIGTLFVELAPGAVPSVQLVTLAVVLVAVHLSRNLRAPLEH